MNHIAEFLALEPRSFFHGLSPEESTKKYRAYARRLHPDLASDNQKQQAHEAFTILTRLWEERTKSHTKARMPHDRQNPRKSAQPAVLKTPRYTYYDLPCNQRINLGAFIYFDATYGNTGENATIYLETTRLTESNAAPIVNAAHALTTIYQNAGTRMMHYAPEIIDHERTLTGTEVLTTQAVPQGFVSLAHYRHSGGLHTSEVTWVFRELVTALKKTHELGLVNGAITPGHVYINPATKRVFLPYWASSVTEGNPLAFYATQDEASYPVVATRGNRINGSVDLRMAATTMLQRLSPEVPASLRVFFEHCVNDTLIDEEEVLREFEEACEKATRLRARVAASWARRKMS